MIPSEFVDRLLRVSEDQATASGALAELQRQNVANTTAIRQTLGEQAATMERIASTLDRIEQDQKEGREVAVQALKDHVSNSGKPNAIIGWIIAAAATIGAASLALIGHKAADKP